MRTHTDRPSRFTLLAALTLVVVACQGQTTQPPPPPPPPPPAPPPAPPPPAPIASQQLRCSQTFGDPAASPYRLPYPVGRTYRMFQGNCPSNPAWGHNGWLAYDFDLRLGDTVVASRAGTVAFVEQGWPDSDRICGHENSVWVRHGDGTVMGYLHLTTNGARVSTGQRVEAGQLLGLSGDSGCSSGPHLHVGLFYNATNFDKENSIPLNYHNADGPLTSRKALVQDASYTATSVP